MSLSRTATRASGDTEGGAPMSIFEAQASGMPVVSTLHADIPEVVLHDRNGTQVAHLEDTYASRLAPGPRSGA